MWYSGDLTPTSLASGTAINTATEVTVSTVNEINIARVVKPIIYVKLTTATATTGSVTVTYACRIADLPATTATTATVTIPVYLVNGVCYGYYAFSSDYSTLGITKVKNDTNKNATAYEVGITGLLGN